MPSQGALANPGYAGLEPTGPTYTTLPGDGKGRDIGALGNPSYASSAVGRPGSGMVNPMYGEQPDQPPVYETIPGELAGQDADNARSGGGGYLEVIPTGTPGYASVDDMLAASTGTYGPDISIYLKSESDPPSCPPPELELRQVHGRPLQQQRMPSLPRCHPRCHPRCTY